MSYRFLLVSDDHLVRTITFHRPESRNAMNPEMQEELIAALAEAGQSPKCRIVILAGAGEDFCAGLDHAYLETLAASPAAEPAVDAERTARLFRTLYELPKPTIAAVHGAAIAGGTALATICDFTLAVPETKFGYTEVRIGFLPALVSVYLSLQVGDKRARALLLTGRLFTAQEAYDWGLVNEVVAHEDLGHRARLLAETLLANSPKALAATKGLLSAQNRGGIDAAVERATHALTDPASSDLPEGVSALLGKRRPSWKH